MFAALVAFSGSVFAGAVMPTSTRYTSGVLASPSSLNESSVYTFPSRNSGGVPVSITANNVFPIGGDPSYISRVGSAALGVGLVAAGLFSVPAVVAAMNVLAVGSVGYALWQALKSQGVSVSSDGSTKFAAPSDPAALFRCNWTGWGYVYDGPCSGAADEYNSVYVALGSPNPHLVNLGFASGGTSFNVGLPGNVYAVFQVVGSLPPPLPVPATNQNISDAINAAVADPNVAADTLAYAIANGLDVKSMLPSATPNLNTVPSVHVGPEYTTGTQTDAAGNTVRTTAQVTTTLAPGATAADYANATQVTTVRNYLNDALTPSTSSTKVGTPSVLPSSQPVVPFAPGSSTSTSISTSSTLTLPTDYNREVTQSKIADALAVSPSAALADTETADMNALTGDSGTIIPHIDRTQLSGTVNFPSSGSCTPLNFKVAGVTYNADPCPMVNYLHPLVNYLFVFLFGILNLRLAFKNDEVAA